jgi:hypothetical protein
MRRSRAWAGVGGVAVAAVGAAALAWPAIPAAGSGGSGGLGSGPGTLAVSSSGTVTASLGTVLTFSFTAPAPPPSRNVTVTLPMPPGWVVAAQPSLVDLTCAGVGCSLVTSSGPIEVRMSHSATGFTLAVQVTPPGSAGSVSFTADENWLNPVASLQATSAPVTVICPADGLGTMAVSPSTVAVASSGTFTFTYTAGSCAAGADGMVGVTVPDGWPTPSPAMAPAGDLASGAQVSFTYGPAQASSTGPACGGCRRPPGRPPSARPPPRPPGCWTSAWTACCCPAGACTTT